MTKKVKTIRVTQTSSAIGRKKDQGATLKGLGLRGMYKTNELPATDCVMGMVEKVRHLLKVEDVK